MNDRTPRPPSEKNRANWATHQSLPPVFQAIKNNLLARASQPRKVLAS